MNKVNIGDKIKIIHMEGEPHYKDRVLISTMQVKFMVLGEAVLSFLKLILI